MGRRVIIISGAGISVESGIRAFRTDTASGKALWIGNDKDPETGESKEKQYSIDQVCNINAFNGGFYGKTHDFYNKRREELSTVEPNLAHMRAAEWDKRYPGQMVHVTTNVDDLFERAGISHEDVLHVHGYLPEVIIQKKEGDQKVVEDIGYSALEIDDYHWAKPNVVFFGEYAPAYSDLNSLMGTLTMQDLVIIVGCSGQVIDFTDESIHLARWSGHKTWVVNPAPTPSEIRLNEDGEIMLWIAGAVDAFSNPQFIKLVEKHLEG